MKIIKANIRREEKYRCFVENYVDVEYENGDKETIFSYFPDELAFSSDEFTNLTKDEALKLFHKKDVEYLRS